MGGPGTAKRAWRSWSSKSARKAREEMLNKVVAVVLTASMTLQGVTYAPVRAYAAGEDDVSITEMVDETTDDVAAAATDEEAVTPEADDQQVADDQQAGEDQAIDEAATEESAADGQAEPAADNQVEPAADDQTTDEATTDEATPEEKTEDVVVAPAISSLEVKNETTDNELSSSVVDNHLVFKVGYDGLAAGSKYTVKVELMDRRTAEGAEAQAVLQGKPDDEGATQPFAWSVFLTPDEATGTAEIDAESVDLSWVAGAAYIVRATVVDEDGATIAERTFDADGDAKVYVPAIASALAAADGSAQVEAAADVQVADAVTVTGLPKGAEATVAGALADADANAVSAGSVALVADENGRAEGIVDYPAFDATELNGAELASVLTILVADEDGNDVAVAKFPSSEGQARQDEPAAAKVAVGAVTDEAAKAEDAARTEDATEEKATEPILQIMASNHNPSHSKEFDDMDKDGATEGDGVIIDNLSVKWVSSDSDGISDGDDSLLSMKSSNDTKIPAVANIEYSISGTGEFQPGEIRLYFPYGLLISESSARHNSVIVIDSPKVGLPKAPDTSQDFNYYYTGSWETGYYVVVTNTKPLSGAITGTIPVEWDLTPKYIKDQEVSNAWYAFMEVDTPQGNTLRATTSELRAILDTNRELTSAEKSVASDGTQARKPQRVPASQIPSDMIPEKYLNETDFVIVDWVVKAYAKGNQWFTLDIEDTLNTGQDQASGVAKDGFIYKVDFSKNAGRVFYDQENTHIRITRTFTFDTYFDSNAWTPDIHIYSAYPASQFVSDTEYIFHNDVTYTLTPGGGVDPATTKSASKSISYQWHKSTWDETVYNFILFKYGNDGAEELESYSDGDMVSHKPENQNTTVSRGASSSYQGWYGIYDSAINGLQQGQDQELWYTVYGGGQFIPLTLQKPDDADMVEGGWQWAKWDDATSKYVVADSVGSDWMDYATYNPTTEEYDVDTTHTNGYRLMPYQAIEDNYLKRPVTMVNEGLAEYLGGKVVNESDYNQHIENGQQLTPGTDYVFKYVEVGKPKLGKMEVFTDEAHNPSWGYATDSDISKAPITYIQVQQNGTWTQTATEPESANDWYAKVDWTSGSPVTTYNNGTTENSAVVKLPDDCTNFRTIFTSRGNASVEQNVYPCMLLKASSNVKDAADASFTDSTGNKVYSPSLYVFNGVISKPYLWNNDGTAINAQSESPRSRYGEDRLDGFSAEVAVYPSKKAEFNRDVDVDYTKNQATVHYTIKVEERSYISDPDLYQQAIDQGLIKEETKGVWYDLLPEGMILDRNSVKLRDGDTRTGLVIKENWNGTGRTLVIVKADLAASPEAYKQSSTSSVSYWKNVPTLTFDATMDLETWIDLGGDPTGAQGGIAAHNVVAFESGNDVLGTVDNHAGEYNVIDQTNALNDATKNGTFSDVEKTAIHKALEDLSGRTTPSYVYSECTTNVAFPKATLAMLSKNVRVNDETSWGQGLATDVRDAYVGGKYEYRLRMMNDASTTSKGLVFFDNLESYVPVTGNEPEDVGAPTWRGTLVEVDTTELASKVNGADDTATCNPVVYYSTVANLQFADATDSSKPNAQYTDVTDSSVWSPVAPADLSTVTAIAIDCSKDTNDHDFVLESNSSMVAVVKMRAPQGQDAAAYIQQEAHAYNNLYLMANNAGDNGVFNDATVVHHDYTKVGLKNYDIPVHKEWSDYNNRDRKRPTEVEVTLTANGVEADATITANNTIVLNESNSWTGVFENLPYTDANGDTIDYNVIEKNVPTDYTCSVKVGDVSVNGAKKTGYIVTNAYKPESTTVTATKTWVGDDPTVRPASIQLQLLADNQLVTESTDWDHPLINPVTIKPDDTGNWPSYTFKNLYKYKDGQEIKYEVREIVPDDSYLSAVTDNGDGTFDVVNTYHPYGDVSITKRVVGATAQASQTEFEFTVILEGQVADTDGKTTYSSLAGGFEWESTNGTNGTVADGQTIKLKDGETVTIKDLPKGARVTFEETEIEGYTAAADGIASTTVRPNHTRKTAVINVYYAKGEANLTATKKLEGAPLKAARFRFELIDEDSGRTLRTAPNLADGTVDFGTIEYTKADDGKTYHYIIREIVPADATNASGVRYADATDAEKAAGGFVHDGATYDTNEYKATVSVADTQGNGTLDVDVQYDKDERIFENSYEASGAVKLNAWKVLDDGGAGRELAADEFEFELVPVKGVAADGTEIPADQMPLPVDDQGTAQNPDRKTNDTQGVISFDTIGLDQSDIDNTYYYVAYEVPGDDDTLVYSDQVFGYKVEVVDNNDGTLTGIQTMVETTKTDDGYEFGDVVDLLPVFINKLQPGGLRIWKLIKGKTPDPDTEFTFKVKLTGEHVDADAVYDIDIEKAEMVAEDVPSDLTAQADESTLPAPLQFLHDLFTPTTAQAATGAVVDQGEFGVNKQGIWKLYEDGELVVSPKGSEVTWDRTREPYPWVSGLHADNVDLITKITFKETIHVQGNLKNLLRDSSRNWPNIITSADMRGLETSQVTDMSYAFYGFTGTELIFGGKFDTSNVTNMQNMFHLCDNITDLDLSCFNTSNVESMLFMFSQDYHLTNLTGLENWDTGKVKTMNEMFYECYYLKTPSINNWDVSSVEDFGYFMLGCYDVSELDLSSWNPKSAISMSSMFSMYPNSAYRPWEECYSRLTTIGDVSGWDVSHVTNMSSMFYDCGKLTELPGTENWDTSSVTSTASMFAGCAALTQLDLSGWDTANVNSYGSMFSGCSSLEWLDVSGFSMKDTMTNNQVRSMFGNDRALREIELGPEFVFYPGSNTATNELPTPSGSRATGRWMRVDGTGTPTGDVFTPQDLATNWDASYAGTWVWEEDAYTIHFDANGGSGAMADLSVQKDSFNLTDNEFDAPESLGETYTFEGWSTDPAGDVVLKDAESVSIGSNHTLLNASGAVAGTFTPGTQDATYEITLYAKWSNLNYKIEYKLDDADAAAGATGSMATDVLPSGDDYTIPAPTFYWLGHVVDGWKYTATDADGSVTSGTFKRGGTIKGGTFSGGTTVVLTPTWVDDGDVIEVTDGEFTVTLKGDEVAIIEDQIPAGTKYEIYEETPDGWKLVAWSGDTGTIEVCGLSDAKFTNQYVFEYGTEVDLEAHKLLQDENGEEQPLTEGQFRFQVFDAEGALLKSATNDADGNVTFEGIKITEAGTHTFTIKEVKGNDEGIEYSTETVSATVEVTETTDDDGNIQLVAGEPTYSPDNATFVNKIVHVEPISRTLTINKVAEGANPDTVFTFEVTIADAKGTPISGTFGGVDFNSSGKGTVTINGAGSVAITNLPDGTIFSVSEVKLPTGWSLKSSEGASGRLTEDCTATFTNTTTPPDTPGKPPRLPKTGDTFNMPLVGALAVVGLGAAAAGVYLARKRKQKDEQ